MERIYMIGAGALGLMYGARLARSGVPVIFITRGEQQAAALRESGILFKQEGASCLVPVQAVAVQEIGALQEEELPQQKDWVWFAVKQPNMTSELLQSAERLLAHKPNILCLQNGIGHLELFDERYPDLAVYAGVTTEGAMRMSQIEVRYTGEGTLAFGPFSQENQTGHAAELAQKMLVKTLHSAGISASMSNDMKNRIYEKLLINAVINPLTALYGVKNGALPQDPVRLRLMKALHDESAEILLDAGLRASNDTWARVLAVCESTAANESSMLRDVQAGRMTEIDWINGGIARLAMKTGRSAPLNNAVAAMVRAL